MGIGEQYAGMDMVSLVGAPLLPKTNACSQLEKSTADFIVKVGFDEDGKECSVNEHKWQKAGNRTWRDGCFK